MLKSKYQVAGGAVILARGWLGVGREGQMII